MPYTFVFQPSQPTWMPVASTIPQPPTRALSSLSMAAAAFPHDRSYSSVSESDKPNQDVGNREPEASEDELNSSQENRPWDVRKGRHTLTFPCLLEQHLIPRTFHICAFETTVQLTDAPETAGLLQRATSSIHCELSAIFYNEAIAD